MAKNSLESVPSLSIIGMDKNTGKTTFLNTLIQRYGPQKAIALTSIGYDGEEVDQVTTTQKPRIFIFSGSIIATARKLLPKCECIKEILRVTDLSTPMGEVVIFRAKSSGYVEIAGPSTIGGLKRLKEQILELAPERQFIVDGALSRKSMAGHTLCDASILCTGAALSNSMREVVDKTRYTLDLLGLEGADPSIKKLSEEHQEERILYIKDQKVIGFSESLEKEWVEEADTILMRGLILHRHLVKLLGLNDVKDKTLVIEDGTRAFFEEKTMAYLEQKGIHLKVLSPINLMLVAVNPFSPRGLDFDEETFLKAMQEVTDLPVISTRSFS